MKAAENLGRFNSLAALPTPRPAIMGGREPTPLVR